MGLIDAFKKAIVSEVSIQEGESNGFLGGAVDSKLFLRDLEGLNETHDFSKK